MSFRSKQEGLYGVLTFRAYKTEFGVVIPFVCQQCGKCCREIGVNPAPMDIARISRHLRLDWTEFVRRYVGDIVTCDNGSPGYVLTKQSHPCPFLTRSSTCRIHRVKPSPCRSFPLETDFGDHGIGCPGKKLFLTAKGALRSDRGGDFDTGQGRFPRFDPPDDWIFHSTCFKLRKRGIPEEFVAELVAANGWDVALAATSFRKCPRRRRLT